MTPLGWVRYWGDREWHVLPPRWQRLVPWAWNPMWHPCGRLVEDWHRMYDQGRWGELVNPIPCSACRVWAHTHLVGMAT